MIRLPTMALARPPSLPGGGVVCRNRLGRIASRPLTSRVPRIAASQNSPITVAVNENASRTVLAMRRWR